MKVLMAVCNYFNPDNRVFRAADALSENGFSVNLLSYHKEGLETEEVLGHGFSLSRLSLSSFIKRPSQLANYFQYRNFKKKAKKVADKVRPDIVHCHDYNTLFLGVYCKKKFGSKLIYDNHEYFQDLTYLHRYPKTIRRYIARYERKIIDRYVDRMIVVSGGIAEEYQRLTGIEPIIVRNIPDVDFDDTVLINGANNLMLKEAKKNGEELLLYLGTNFTRGRGLTFISELLKALPEKYVLYVFGCKDDREVENLNNLFKDQEINSKVRIFKFISLSELFQMGSYFSFGLSIIEPIYFSYKHSLPNKLFEYIMMGIPVIVSDIPEQSNLVRKYNIGIIAKLNQAADLAKQISEKKTDRKQAIIKAQKELNWQMEKKKLISIYATPFK